MSGGWNLGLLGLAEGSCNAADKIAADKIAADEIASEDAENEIAEEDSGGGIDDNAGRIPPNRLL